MFEQSVIAGSPKGKRVWTTCVGVTGQALLVTGMVVAPMLWPQVMPPASFVMLVPHAPAGDRPKSKPRSSGRRRSRPENSSRSVFTSLVQPAKIQTVNDLRDPPGNAATGPGLWIDGRDRGWWEQGGTGRCPGGGAGVGAGDFGGAEVEPAKAAATTPRFRTGGNIREPRLIHRVDPPYPLLAKQAHVEGVVRLTGVISVDGRIAALTVESGNPLLVPAARDAVRQWLYEPTLLNGVPVEIMTSIIVTFTLNR